MNVQQLQSLRREVRTAMNLLPKGQKATVEFIRDSIRDTTPLKPSRADVEQALLWNQSSGWCDFRWNREMNWDEWFLTERGVAKVKGGQG